MANAVLYNQGSHPAGALKSGTMSMNVSPSLDIGALKWRNGFENNNTWVIYSDTYSQGQATQGNSLPTIWASTDFTDVGLLNLINVLPARAGQIPFTDVTAATSWLRGQGVYFLSNQNYPQIVTSGLTMIMDAGFTASFPNGTGTTWYDLSGNDNNGTLNNGPTWVNSGTTSYLSFDGSNDYVQIAVGNQGPLSIIGTGDFTFSALATNTGVSGYRWLLSNWLTTGTHMGRNGNGRFGGYFGDNDEISSNYYIPEDGSWHKYVTTRTSGTIKFYVDGVERNISNGVATGHTNTMSSATNTRIGTRGDNVLQQWLGRISNELIYNRALSQSEILQDYYKGPIVTSGLVFAVDGNNLISNQGGSNTVRSLTGSMTGTLTNGCKFNTGDGGCWEFDGSDDKINFGNPSEVNFTTGDFTISTWFKISQGGNYQIIIQKGNPGVGSLPGYRIRVENSNVIIATITANNPTQERTVDFGSAISVNTWYNAVLVRNGGNISSYLNGNFVKTATGTVYNLTTNESLFLGATESQWPLNGKIGSAYIYNRVLTSQEISQNFNAQRGRFGI